MQTEVREAIRQYLDSISRHLSSLPDLQQAEMLRDIQAHIYDALRDRTEGREPTLLDVDAVIAEMDPPESYARISGNPVPCTTDFISRIGRGRRIPGVLMFGLSIFALIVVVQLMLGITRGDFRILIGATVGGLALVGLYVGNKAAYVVTILGVAWGTIHAVVTKGIGFGIAVLLADCLVLIPVLLCTSYFFPQRHAGSNHLTST